MSWEADNACVFHTQHSTAVNSCQHPWHSIGCQHPWHNKHRCSGVHACLESHPRTRCPVCGTAKERKRGTRHIRNAAMGNVGTQTISHVWEVPHLHHLACQAVHNSNVVRLSLLGDVLQQLVHGSMHVRGLATRSTQSKKQNKTNNGKKTNAHKPQVRRDSDQLCESTG